jgi:hypothetical protein
VSENTGFLIIIFLIKPYYLDSSCISDMKYHTSFSLGDMESQAQIVSGSMSRGRGLHTFDN